MLINLNNTTNSLKKVLLSKNKFIKIILFYKKLNLVWVGMNVYQILLDL